MGSYKPDTKEITHLRCLADAITICPDKTGDFFTSLIKIITTVFGRYTKARSLDDPFVVFLHKMQKDLGPHPDHSHVKKIADKYTKSDNILVRRAGEILLWSLKNRNKLQT